MTTQLEDSRTEELKRQQQQTFGAQFTGVPLMSPGGAQYTSTTTEHHVMGQERIVSTREAATTSIVGERTVERTVTVPKKIVYEDVVERHYVVPEVSRREEVIEEVKTVKERIIQMEKEVEVEKTVEVPEIVYIDKVVQVPQVVYENRYIHVPKVQYEERITEVPTIITQEKIVEVPEREYRQYVVEKVVEVPEIHEEIVTREIPVPRYVDKMVPTYVEKEKPFEVRRNIPIPVEVEATFEYHIPRYKPRVNIVNYPVYLPRFIEVPVPEETFGAQVMQNIKQAGAQVALLGQSNDAASLCEIENLATAIHAMDIGKDPRLNNPNLMSAAVKEAWANGQLRIVDRRGRNQITNNTGLPTRHRSASPLMNRRSAHA